MEGKEQNSIYTINLSLRSTNANITEEEKEDTYGFGFIGTIDGFINLANEIKPIKTKSLDELFENTKDPKRIQKPYITGTSPVYRRSGGLFFL